MAAAEAQADPSFPDLVRLYVDEMKSIPDIAALLGEPRSRVRQRLLNLGVSLRSRADGVRAAAHKLGKNSAGKKRIFIPEWCANMSAARLRSAEASATGVSLKPSGYVEYTRGLHKGRSIHVVAMETRLGRHLLPDEVVHHIDGNRQNNDINNLALMTRSAHTRLHRREERISHKEKRYGISQPRDAGRQPGP
jgi:hypothetical protein